MANSAASLTSTYALTVSASLVCRSLARFKSLEYWASICACLAAIDPPVAKCC